MTQNTAKLSVTPETFTILPSSAPDSVLQITNVSFVPILYRALSTAPKQFQVRPRQGVVQSGQSASITISYNAKAVDPADEAKAERKEDFKIEYCQMTAEHQDILKQEEASNGDSTAKITELIKASAKGDKKSRVVSCIIRNKDEETTTAAAPTKAAVPVAENTEAARPSANRTSQAVNATTDMLNGPGEQSGIRSRATTGLADNTNAQTASVEKPRPSVASSSAKTPELPQKKTVPNGGAVAAITRDPVGYLKQNPLIIVGALVGLYIIFKVIF